jgi:hypothetical protein
MLKHNIDMSVKPFHHHISLKVDLLEKRYIYSQLQYWRNAAWFSQKLYITCNIELEPMTSLFHTSTGKEILKKN